MSFAETTPFIAAVGDPMEAAASSEGFMPYPAGIEEHDVLLMAVHHNEQLVDPESWHFEDGFVLAKEGHLPKQNPEDHAFNLSVAVAWVRAEGEESGETFVSAIAPDQQADPFLGVMVAIRGIPPEVEDPLALIDVVMAHTDVPEGAAVEAPAGSLGIGIFCLGTTAEDLDDVTAGWDEEFNFLSDWSLGARMIVLSKPTAGGSTGTVSGSKETVTPCGVFTVAVPGAVGAPVYDDEPEGGLQLGGTCTTEITYDNTPEGGILLDGTCESSLPETDDRRGVLTWLELEIPHGEAGLVYTDAPAGGVVLAGSCVSEVIYDQAPEGGLRLDGQAASEIILDQEPAGGLVLGGRAVSDVEYADEPEGGLALDGAASSSIVYDDHTAGGPRLSGACESSIAHDSSPSGGVRLDGTCVSTIQHEGVYDDHPIGGITLAGSCTSTVSYQDTPAGGIQLDGVCTSTLVVAGSYDDHPAGGVILGGSCVSEISYQDQPSGGITYGGICTSDLVYADEPRGGIVLDGTCTTSDTHTHDDQPAGGVVLTGSCLSTITYTDTPTGGLILGGHIVQPQAKPTATAPITVIRAHAPIQVVRAHGPIRIL